MKIFLVLILCMAQSASAYSPGAHKQMVKSSAQDYNFCLDVLKSPKPKLKANDIKKITKSNVLEDINPVNKLQHWHFYHPTKDLGHGTLGFGFGSFTHRYDEVEASMKKKNIFKSLGSLSHYLQDVTNPAHVAPIYHGLGDGFDFYDFKSRWPAKITAEKCVEIAARVELYKASKETSTFVLVKRITHETLAKMQEKVLINTKEHQGFFSWEEAFWSVKYGPTSKQANFGEYGFLGNTFGKPTSGVDAKTTEAFAKDRVRASLDATVELLMMRL